MPGIVGIIDRQGRDSEEALDSMLACLRHDPAYRCGRYISNPLGVSVGWAGHAGSFSDCLPIWNERKDICLFFAGENFPEPAEVDRLKSVGHSLTPGNLSYLVHLYEETGLRFIERLNGWFSGLVVDLREKRAILFNDRYGLQRIYFYEQGDRFFFASEAKCLLKVLPELRRLDLPSLAEFAACGCTLQNRSLFAGIGLLPGASSWTFAPNQPVRRESYFSRETWEQQERLGTDEYYVQLKESFPRIVQKYFAGNGSIAMSLTGGLDGRMIMAWAGRPEGSLPCYTFGGMYRDCGDVKLARKVAIACGQPHRVISVGKDFLRSFPELAQKAVYVSDGAMDVTGSVELHINKMAREIAPIRLTGNYGSEILRQSVAFRSRELNPEVYSPEFVRMGHVAGETYGVEARCQPLSFIAFKQVPWFHCARLKIEQSQLTLRSPYLDNDLVSLAFRAPATPSGSQAASLRLVSDGNQKLGRIPTDRGLMLHPVPVLTRASQWYTEFTSRAEYAYDYGMPHWLARMERRLPPLRMEKLFLGQHKFYHFRVWYRNELSGYVRDVLLDPRAQSRAHLRPGALANIVGRHLKGTGNFTSEIHRLLTIELMYRELVERN